MDASLGEAGQIPPCHSRWLPPSGTHARLHGRGRVQVGVQRVPVAHRHVSEPLSDARRPCARGRSTVVPAVGSAQVGHQGREPHAAPSGTGSAPGRHPTFESRAVLLFLRERAILGLLHTTTAGRDMHRWFLRMHDDLRRGLITEG